MGWTQPKIELQMKKPKQFEQRQLGSEKSADKKFTVVRRFFQNTYTHYNYYYNGNLKINQIIDYATQAHKDDYTTLLSFHPYSLDVTSRSGDIDSILETATAGILLHDLRNDWIDDLYLVIGKAYLLRKDYDSAMKAFQFLNYSFAPKEKGGYDVPIGSNALEGSNALSVSTREKTSLSSRIFSNPPSRNESFVWMIRTLTEKGSYLDAYSLISTIVNDPVFPDRLKPELHENIAYLYYKIEQWDSAATYLEKSIAGISGIEARSRAWFLSGQLYQKGGNYASAVEAFQNASKSAVDPVLDIYARLNTIRMRKSDDPSIIDQNIAALKDLAKKDRYRLYRDIIYYAAAMFELERDGYEAADGYLQQSLAVNYENPDQRSQTFLLMGDARYKAKKYGKAALPYDSADIDLVKPFDSLRVMQRRPGTKAVYEAEEIIAVYDSLLQLASMSEEKRIEYVKTLNKKLRKERGLKEEALPAGNMASAGGSETEIFAGGSTWYFYDAARRANGFNSFRRKWGDRPNADNWRRSSAISTAAFAGNQRPQPTEPDKGTVTTDDGEKYDTTDISFDNLYSRIPLSEERQLKANNRINKAMFAKANALYEKLEDYPEAIKVYEALLERLDSGQMVAPSLFNLIYCYNKVGNKQAAAEAQKALERNFPKDPLTLRAKEAKSPEPPAAEKEKAAATKMYEKVYSLFLEGSFEKAVALKKETDLQFGKNYWTPQLVYIETVYFLQKKDDSAAMRNLDAIINQFPDHPLAARAKIIKEVLPKRKEIEAYLTELDVVRAQDDKVVMPAETVPTKKVQPSKQQAPSAVVPNTVKKPTVDSSAVILKPAAVASTEKALPYNIDANGPQMVAIVLENIDPAYVNEVNYSFSNHPKRNYVRAPVTVEKKKLRDKLWLILIRSDYFTNATTTYEYIDYIKPLAAKEILTWLDVKKYHFIMLSTENLQKLEADPKLDVYEQILKQTFPGKF